MLRMKTQNMMQRLGMKGRNFGRVHLPLISYVKMIPLGSFLYGEMMVIRLLEGIHEVNWFCNPK
jgi:hypothetical protein